MRDRRCIFNMLYHYGTEIGSCDYCDQKASYHIGFGTFLGRGHRFLCEHHYREWMKGELFV